MSVDSDSWHRAYEQGRKQGQKEAADEIERLESNQKLSSTNAYSEDRLAERCAKAEAEIERLRQLVKTLVEADPRHDLYQRMYAENERLRAALRMVLDNMGGHQHWDSFGTAGANCPICQRQMEAAKQARSALDGEKG